MSMYSKLTRDKNGSLMLDGKPYVVGLDTGDETPVAVDERLDVDLNKLVSNEMARQELLKIPGPSDYPDLTEYPESRGDAERRLRTLAESLQPKMAEGESLEQAMRRHMVEAAKVQASDSKRADSEPAKPEKDAKPADGDGEPSGSKPGADSGPFKA